MDKKPKVVALVTASLATKKELCAQLQMLLADYVTVEGYATEEGIHGRVEADLIVLSSYLMVEEAKDILGAQCPIILANRALNMEHLEELFHIPKGATVLVVNDEQETAFDLLRLLLEAGIDYLEYVPYWPGAKCDKEFDTAVVAGDLELVPGFVKNIINVGPRVIDITTVIEILSIFGLLDEKARLITARYMETIIRLNKRLSHTILEVDSANHYLTKVLNGVNEGILAFTDEGLISVFNEKSQEIFGIKHGLALNKHIDQIFKDVSICQYLLTVEEEGDRLFQIGGSDVLISKFKIEKQKSTVCTIKNTKETLELERKLRQQLIKKGYIGKYRFSDIKGSSAILTEAIEKARKLAKPDLNLLIYGESGVGKELFASAIHNESPRRNGPFLAVNFSALPEELAESELFGYDEGAFTGAKKGGKIGLFEQACGGTIFLDEIGDVSLRIQARLLRVLQEKELRRVGGEEIIPVDVRIIAATNKDLFKMCEAGTFREDLYHRLKNLYLEVPPLRVRLSDLDELLTYFLRKNGRETVKFSQEAKEAFLENPWTGNVRELENTVEYLLAVSEGESITLAHMPETFVKKGTDLLSQEKRSGAQEKESEEKKKKEESQEDERQRITGFLADRGSLDELYFLLRIVHRAGRQGQSISRTRAAELGHGFGISLSPDQVRRRVQLLQEAGLLVKGTGRGGMRLTFLGRRYVEAYLL